MSNPITTFHLGSIVQASALVACLSGISGNTSVGNTTGVMGEGEEIRLFYVAGTGFNTGKLIINETLVQSLIGWQDNGGWVVNQTFS
jgi:hypothetical protein